MGAFPRKSFETKGNIAAVEVMGLNRLELIFGSILHDERQGIPDWLAPQGTFAGILLFAEQTPESPPTTPQSHDIKPFTTL